jgi:hypothetical protein
MEKQASKPTTYEFTLKDIEAAKRGYLYPWKGEKTIHHLTMALCNMRMTPKMWTAGNILFMLSFHFRYREGDTHQIFILNEKGQHAPKDATWFVETCNELNHFTFSGLRITTIWFMFAYKFFERKGHLLPALPSANLHITTHPHEHGTKQVQSVSPSASLQLVKKV